VISLVFVIPGQLREFAAGRSELRIEGEAHSVSDALSLLWRECPGARDRVLTERGDVRTHINIFVDGENIRHAGGLDAPVADGTELIILPAVSGGGPGPGWGDDPGPHAEAREAGETIRILTTPA
jgi:molybdopterin converting factor small subunit